MTTTVFFNKEFVDASDASLSIQDGGWLHGAGLFETMRAENGHVFRFESHIDRLRRSAESILLPIERGTLPTTDDVSELLARNGLTKARLRLTVSAGPVKTEPQTEEAKLTVCLTATELTSYPSKFYEKGIATVICPHRISPSDPMAGHKTTAYLPRLLGLRDAQQAHCVEAIWFTTDNQLAEGCISNVFIVSQGALKTPPARKPPGKPALPRRAMARRQPSAISQKPLPEGSGSDQQALPNNAPVLPGITRAVVLEIAGRTGISTQECPLTIDDLLDADEVLLTNSIMQIMPVTRVERHDIAEGRVGPMAKTLLDEYRAIVREECGDE